jgi:hypothetical protein
MVAITGNCEIFAKLTAKWGLSISNSLDRYKKTPAMYAIMNNNN